MPPSVNDLTPDAAEWKRVVRSFPKTTARVVGLLLFVLVTGACMWATAVWSEARQVRTRLEQVERKQAADDTANARVDERLKAVEKRVEETGQDVREIKSDIKKLLERSRGR